MNQRIPSTDDLPAADRDRVQRFLAAFNAIDALLRERTGVRDAGVSFRSVLRRYGREQRWKHADRVDDYADLRNVLVHETITPNGWLAIPTEDVVARIESIRDGLAGGRRADQAFQKEVATVAPDLRLRDALVQVHTTGFSQFPIVEDDTVVGLLTDRAIARWLADRAADPNTASITTAVGEARVAEVVRADGERRTWDLAARDEPAERVLARFVASPNLEAVLITQHGKPGQGLIGIATHADVVRSWDEG